MRGTRSQTTAPRSPATSWPKSCAEEVYHLRNGVNAESCVSRGPKRNACQRQAAEIFTGLLAGLLLALMAVLAGGAGLRESLTIDEVAQIGAGVSYLQKA